jgi:hypothetical protein
MKRLLILIISCLCFTQAFCDDHLKFLGFPIDGTVNEYASKIKSKGFYVSPDNVYARKGLRIMEGPFLGKTRKIGLHYNEDTKIIYNVTLVVEKFLFEKDAKVLYDKLESLLHEKYPNATFNPSAEVERTIFSCSFKGKEGIICLGIFDERTEYRVKMSYTDRINYIPIYEKEHQDALDDL